MHQDTHTLILMTDPICSWCWGMVPELQRLQMSFEGRLSFKLRCAGLQVGSKKPLSGHHKQALNKLWQAVADTTGQQFAYTFPRDDSFIYHSELACRAIEIVRQQTGREPFDYYYRLQEAFYLEARNISDPRVLFELASTCGISEPAFLNRMESAEIVDLTRMDFAWCEQQAMTALPTLFLDQGNGPELVCGGYSTADYLIPDIRTRLTTHLSRNPL